MSKATEKNDWRVLRDIGRANESDTPLCNALEKVHAAQRAMEGQNNEVSLGLVNTHLDRIRCAILGDP